MKNKFGLWYAVCILFCACVKEKSLENGGKGGSLLVRSSAAFSSDSTVSLYAYDADKRLTVYQSVVAFQGVNNQSTTKFNRNAQGIIQQVILIDPQLTTAGIDSAVYKVNYDAAKQRYTSRVAQYGFLGFVLKDSIAYTYDAGGRIIKEEEFFDDSQSGGYGEFTKMDYTYDAEGNVIKWVASGFDPTSGTYQPLAETTYEYDANVNPLKLTLEAFVIGNPSLLSAHNVSKITTTDLTNSANDQTTTITYTYNTDKKPAAGTGTVSGAGGTAVFTFTYQ